MKYFTLIWVLFFTQSHAYTLKNENALIYQLNNRFQSDIRILGAKEKQCKLNQKRLSVSEIKELSLDKKTVTIALKYFYLKAMVGCTNHEKRKYLTSSSLLSVIDKNSRAKVEISNEAVLDEDIQLLDVEMQYIKLDENVKRKLRSIKQLNEPFDLIKAANDLDI